MTNKQQKIIQQLQTAKFREKFGFFVLEGTKIVREFCLEMPEQVEWLAATAAWLEEHSAWLKNVPFQVVETTDAVLKANSTLQTSPSVLLLARQLEAQTLENQAPTGLSLVLETIQDPGNMGTIIRTADWFGVQRIYLSADCVDVYNPKVIQASMGSLWRVELKIIADLPRFFQEHATIPVFGAVLGGENMHELTALPETAFLIMGNESKGISAELTPFLTKKITIPRIGRAESLNVAIATGILLAYLKKG